MGDTQIEDPNAVSFLETEVMSSSLQPVSSPFIVLLSMNTFYMNMNIIWLMAYKIIKASPVERDESKNEVNSSWPAVSTISTWWTFPSYVI